MNISINDLAEAIRNNNSESLILYQDDDVVSFTNLHEMNQQFGPMMHSSFRLNVKDEGLLEWQIVKSESGNGFRIYCRTLDRIICRNGVFELPAGRMTESTPDSKFFEMEPGRFFRSHENFLLDKNCEVSFVLHEDLICILPMLWKIFGLDPNLIDDLMEENPYIDDPWDCSFLIGCHTKADAIQKLYPDAKLFDEINDMEFESACLFADGQEYITADDLDSYIETVRQNLLSVRRREYYMKCYFYYVAEFLAKAFQKKAEKNGEILNPYQTDRITGLFIKRLNPGSTIPFGTSYAEFMD